MTGNPTRIGKQFKQNIFILTDLSFINNKNELKQKLQLNSLFYLFTLSREGCLLLFGVKFTLD